MIQIDLENDQLILQEEDKIRYYDFSSPQAFKIISDIWLRLGWDNKQVYSFTWMGRPIIQLPEDMVRMQEVIYQLQPDVLIETGVAHGGSLVFYASLFKAMGKGRVIGIDIEIRPHNRKAIEEHLLAPYITLFEGSSIDQQIVQACKEHISSSDTVLVVLDSCHAKDHVLQEIEHYSQFVSIGSYIVVTDGIMEQVAGAPRTKTDWQWNNPRQAALEYVNKNADFIIEEPCFLFNEGNVTERVTYWPDCFLKRVR